MASLAALALADARFPGGGHVHSGGLEEAVARGLVTGVADLGAFLHGRLRTAGLVAAAFAAAAVATARGHGAPWPALDAELDARTPSAAQRDASRAQGRAALRAARAAWPSPVLDALAAAHPRPHHPLLVGAVVGIDGGGPADAAQCAAYLAVSGPASAAVRLLGLDPFAVNAEVVALRPALDAVVAEAVVQRTPDRLPSPGAPVLDLMAQAHVHHHGEQVRLFVS
ncbi:MAG TPA: urease accessory UreF family protein [Pseudonocardia sp.]|jgi:urease accessory protein|uniref:urease accessory protein UreF n=1 Tax=Pseudonocardia sp. TaxID=60912 RepID=UPI002B4B4F75|nr:urease accessory UreF family protein [Pseudonocardia sp.]HLU58792.1 urease accessory UreF family protein [Pseudonocardia sp.]